MRYPEAQWLGNGQSGGSYTGGPHRLVIHTTETSGLPAYNNGWVAPHITYDPEFRRFYQHTDFNVAARALANVAGGVQTNRRSALQIEVICYSAKNIADQTVSRQWVGDLSDDNYADLRKFVAWCGGSFGVKMNWPGKQALSYSQANASGFRMSGSAWNAFDGVCGHQHIPENTHWDPGAIDWKKLLPTTQPLEEDVMTPAQEATLNAVKTAIDQLLPAVKSVPGEVLGTPWNDTATVKQAIGRTYERSALTFDLLAAVAALDLEGISEAELDERVAGLTQVINAQPAAFVAKLKASL